MKADLIKIIPKPSPLKTKAEEIKKLEQILIDDFQDLKFLTGFGTAHAIFSNFKGSKVIKIEAGTRENEMQPEPKILKIEFPSFSQYQSYETPCYATFQIKENKYLILMSNSKDYVIDSLI